MRSLPAVIRTVATKGIVGAYRELLPEASRDSVEWIERKGIAITGARVLEIGCGRASTGELLQEQGARVSAIDIDEGMAAYARGQGLEVSLADATSLPYRDGSLDLIISINVLCHIREPKMFVDEVERCLRPGALAYVTWTNWLSPMGGHDYSPYHYFGPRLGYRLACKMKHKDGFVQVPYRTLWPNHIGPTLRILRRSGLRLLEVRPRYYPSLSFICRVPIAREFLTWNCQVLLEKPAAGQ